MRTWIVVEITKTTDYTTIAQDGRHEYTYSFPPNGVENDLGDNIYGDPSGVIWALARNEAEAKQLAIRCANLKPGTKWMWFELRGVAECPAGPCEVKEVTDKGMLPE
ncbi:MAG TPA: hypothetical protein VFM18_11505 [Methanosarcina sp.]|nr:hypothetical protein [Methanosarcina sp.]